MDQGWDAVNMARVRTLLAGEALEAPDPGQGVAVSLVPARGPHGAPEHVLGSAPDPT